MKEKYNIFANALKEKEMTIAIIEYSDDTIASLFRESEMPEVLKGANVVVQETEMFREVSQDISSDEPAKILADMAMKKYGADISLGVTENAYAMTYMDETEVETDVRMEIAEEIYHSFFWKMYEKGVFKEETLTEIEGTEKEESELPPPSDIEIVADYVIKNYFKEKFLDEMRFWCGNSSRSSYRRTRRKIKATFEQDVIAMMASYITDKDALDENEREMAEMALNVACVKTPVISGVRYKLKDYWD